MEINRPVNISNFFIAGINYKKTDAGTRGQFAVNNEQYEAIFHIAPSFELDSFFIISTCNRTEIYGFADRPEQLINLLCTQTSGTAQAFKSLAYIKNGEKALDHLFNVGAGLDSQILGDYEIIGQIKQAVKLARERGFINCFLDRLVNCVLQTSKTIKNDTALSGGTVSVSFAAVQYIKSHFQNITDKKILLVGTGKIGRNTCKNLVDYLGTTNITLVNRSEEKAVQLAAELNLKHAPINDLEACIADADIILTATSATEPTILSAHLKDKGEKLIIDLSVPNNVESSVKGMAGITLINVDELGKLKDETLQKREAEAPKAKMIIAEQMAEFMDWHQMRKNAPALKAIKTKLNQISAEQQFAVKTAGVCPLVKIEVKIQRVINSIAAKMRAHNRQGCHYIEAINEFMNAG
ncbi:glutamyl-tRNA reductase [Mucilaginibacter gotjawali]|uniref:Glutamyl-tRNA reductase n=2 Tax=Mucilaginibacter gotjawali TaxID=1550579 RepID=A0A0X8X3E5_9SPHI|nr:glutamyl-tRNA reductase [Mucilaginibacter gotjawali]MBB3056277.1 glutamyl-tRNA reductase [Mucilaginibacter gotjawali]BAU54981.1 Glutamyl-tRNA reductase [Mucilaginibacter gotjawali]